MRKTIVVGLSIALLASSCDKKPSGQTVAVVNGEEITASELNADLAGLNLPAGADKKLATNRVLQSLIDRHLLAEQARKEGIDRSPDFIARQRRMTDDLLISMLANRQLESSKLPDDAAISAVEAKLPQAFEHREMWHLNQLIYPTPTNKDLLAKIRASKTLDEIAATLTAAGTSFTRATNQVMTDVIPPELYPRLNALPAGEPFIVPNTDRSIASAIASRDPAPITGADARAAAANLLRREGSNGTLQQRLKDLRTAAKIEYKSGFGPPK